MASRTIQECDLSKKEYDPDETVTVVFKRKGKKGRSYDLSAESAEALEQAMVGTVPHVVTPEEQRSRDQQSVPGKDDGVRRVGDPEFNIDDDELIARKERERRDYNTQLKDDDEVEIQATQAQENCVHARRTPIRPRMVGDKRGFWQDCKDCGLAIKAKSKRSRAEYLDAHAPRGTNVTTHPSEDRQRD